MKKRFTAAVIPIFLLTACSTSSDSESSRGTIRIRAAIVYKIGGPQPVARTTFYLTKQDLTSLLQKEGKNESIDVFCAWVNYDSQTKGKSKAIDDLVEATAISTATTDFESRACALRWYAQAMS